MLILSRKQEESVVIGNDVIIRVVSIDRGSVKLGFEAPPKTLILRAELKEAVVKENEMASGEPSDRVLEMLSVSIRANKGLNAKDMFKMRLR